MTAATPERPGNHQSRDPACGSRPRRGTCRRQRPGFATSRPGPWIVHRSSACPRLPIWTTISGFGTTKKQRTTAARVSSLRTEEQADLARFVGGAGVHAMLQWHDAWRDIASVGGLSTLDAARLFAMLSTASSDALIGCWDSKYNYAFWRPVTAIRVGGGNPNLEPDPDWIGFVITPNHPEYPAAHGCFSG